MKQIVVNVPDKKIRFFTELIRYLGFSAVKIGSVTSSKKKTLKEIEKGLREVKMIHKGKLPKRKIENLIANL